MRRHRPHLALPVLAAALSLVAAACASGDDQTIATIPATPIETTIPDFIRDAGQFEDTEESAESAESEDADEMSAESEDADDATEEATDEESATATSTTAPVDDEGDDDEDDSTSTTQPETSGTTPPTSSTVPPAAATTTTPPASETTAPPTTAAPATTAPPNTTPPASGGEAAAALAGLNAVLAEAEVVDGASELPLCSLDPSGAQIDEVFDSLSTGPFAEAYGSVTAPLAVVIDEQNGTMITCDRFDGAFDNGMGLSAIAAPADLVAFSEAFANPDGIDGITVTVTPAGSGNGGDFFHVCSVDSIDPTFSYCEVDWISGGLMITAWIAGAASVDVDLASIQAALQPSIDAVLVNLAQAAG